MNEKRKRRSRSMKRLYPCSGCEWATDPLKIPRIFAMRMRRVDVSLYRAVSLIFLSPSFRFLFSHPLLSTSPSFHASFLPHSTDGFTRTLSLFLPLFLSFSHPLFEFYLFFNFPFSQMNFPNCCLRLLKLVSIFIEIVSNGTSDITDIFLEDIHNFINHLV